jgi:hypothetical protein
MLIMRSCLSKDYEQAYAAADAEQMALGWMNF